MTNHPRSAINVCPVHGDTGNEPCAICYQPPTLTCSEVVERLAECADVMPSKDEVGEIFIPTFDRERATAILHSWRERRVQELEEALREIVNERYTELDMMRCEYQHGTIPNEAWHAGVYAAWKQFDHVKKIAKDTLAKSEQIRKGAKHEGA